MSERPPRDSKPDAPSESDAPPSPIRPALPERVRTIEIMTGTLIGAHLPPLLENDEAKPIAPPLPAPDPIAANALDPLPGDDEPTPVPAPFMSPLAPEKVSPVQMILAWLARFRSTPPRLVGIAVGGVVVGALLTTAVRGCGSDGDRVRKLEARIAVLEQTVGVSNDAGSGNSSDNAATLRVDAVVDAGVRLSSSSPGTDDPKKAKCAMAKVAAYQAWQDAIVKAKANAAPAEAECANLWTQAKKQACYYTASQNVRAAQAARDAVMKGGSAARDALKNVKDDPKNDAIAAARGANEAVFSACQDDNEF